MLLIETVNRDDYVHSIGKDLGYANIFTLPPQGLSGGLAIFWDQSVNITFGKTSMNHTDIQVRKEDISFCVTYIYGYPDKKKRDELWKEMSNMVEAGMYSQTPRVVMGDFNDIRSNEEKQGGPIRSEFTFKPFRSMLSICGLHEVKTFGGKYTWAGNRYTYSIKTKIDRVFSNSRWQDTFPKAHVRMLSWIGSGHRPLLLDTEDGKWKGKRYFSEALARCREALAQWKHENIINSQKKIAELQRKLHQALEEEYWKAKSRILWLQCGDKNTRFFHEKTKQRRNFNRIIAIQDEEGRIYHRPEEIYSVAENYFGKLYASEQKEFPTQLLEEKSPGADGMNAGFFRQHWNTIKQEWKYLNEIMRRMGFCERWRAWIMKCVTSVTYSVLINGVSSKVIQPQRGIRQDDSLLFCKATTEECHNLMAILKKYEQLSGQAVNYQKSAVTFGKDPNHKRISWISWEKITKNRWRTWYSGFTRFQYCSPGKTRVSKEIWELAPIPMPTGMDQQSYYCLVDASWSSAQEIADISWMLCQSGKVIIKASSSIDATISPLEAEANALRIAVVELRKLGYTSVTFKGDAKALYVPLSTISTQNGVCFDATISIYAKDISNLSSDCNYALVHVPRSTLLDVDRMAKYARKHKTSYVIKWTDL